MSPTTDPDFAALIRVVIERYFRQIALPAPGEAEVAGLAGRLWALVEERGLPGPLASGEPGEPHEMGPDEAGPLVARVLGDNLAAAGPWAAPARQLIKTCFQPEFRKCRDSYREAEADGTRRRQQLAKVRGRVSGAHCVDCPYWTALSPGQHGKLLAKAWVGEAAELTAHRDVFLPEDFRALRRWVRARAARGAT